MTARRLPVQLGLFERPDRWIERFAVSSQTIEGREYVVARDQAGEWGCSCPHWIYRRGQCKHIQTVRSLDGG